MRKKNLFILLSVLIFLAVCIASLEANIKYVFAEMRYGSQGTNSDIVFSKKSGFFRIFLHGFSAFLACAYPKYKPKHICLRVADADF